MTREWLDNLFVEIFTSDETHFDSWASRKIKKHPNVLRYFETRYEFSSSIMETLWRMKYHIENRPKCPTCGKYTLFRGRPNQLFLKFCSIKCSTNSKDTQNKYKETCLKKYGVDNAFKSNIVKEKWKQTNKERFGCEYPSQNEKIKHKMSEVMMSTKVKTHIYNVKKTNSTFNSSKPEEELFLYIKSKFPSVERQYKDNARYPWCCDFYIPEFDLFLELQGIWTHGKHAFDSSSISDKVKLEQWKEKSKEHPFYLNAIKTWTMYDTKKRNMAKENKLNFKEVWSLDEGKSFIDNLYSTKMIGQENAKS